MRFRTITSKLLAVYIPLVLLSVGTLFVGVEVEFYYKQRAELIEELQQIADIHSKSLAAATWEYDTDRLAATAREIALLPHVQGFRIRDSSDEILAESGDPNLPVALPRGVLTKEIEAILDEHLPRLVSADHLVLQPASGISENHDWWPLAEQLAFRLGEPLLAEGVSRPRPPGSPTLVDGVFTTRREGEFGLCSWVTRRQS